MSNKQRNHKELSKPKDTKPISKNSSQTKAQNIIKAYIEKANELKQTSQKSLRDVILANFTQENDKSCVIFPDGTDAEFIYAFDDVELIENREKDSAVLSRIFKLLSDDNEEFSFECGNGELRYSELLSAATPSTPEIENLVNECANDMRELNLLYERTCNKINHDLYNLLNKQIEEYHGNSEVEL